VACGGAAGWGAAPKVLEGWPKGWPAPAPKASKAGAEGCASNESKLPADTPTGWRAMLRGGAAAPAEAAGTAADAEGATARAGGAV
jgi:hypothetical protein